MKSRCEPSRGIVLVMFFWKPKNIQLAIDLLLLFLRLSIFKRKWCKYSWIGENIVSMDFNPDGDRIITMDESSIIVIHDVQSGSGILFFDLKGSDSCNILNHGLSKPFFVTRYFKVSLESYPSFVQHDIQQPSLP